MVTVDRDDPDSLGRIVRDPNGEFERIVETKHPEGIPAEVLAIHEVNTNTFAFEGAALADGLGRITNDNPAGEYYIGDVLRALREQGGRILVHKVDDVSVNIGINTRVELAVVDAPRRAGASSSATCSRVSRSPTRRRPGSTPRSRSRQTP